MRTFLLSKKNLLILITLHVVSAICYVNFGLIKEWIKVFLEVVPLTYICWSYCVIIYGMHFVLLKKHRVHESIAYGDILQYSRFRVFTNSFFDAATYAIASSSGFALIKGLFLQHFYQIKYFEFFNEFDLVTMLIVMIYLLYFSIMAMVRTTVEVLNLDLQRMETPEPVH